MGVPAIRLEAQARKPYVLADVAEQKCQVHLIVRAPTAAEGVSARQLNLGLVIDRSGSMHSDGKLDTAKEAARQVLDLLNDADVFTLVAFNNEVEVIAGGLLVGPNRQAIRSRIDALRAGNDTYLGKGFRQAIAVMTPHVRAGVNSTVYILTDGKTHDEKDSLAYAPQVHQQGISVYAGGIGSPTDAYNHVFLDKITADPTTPGALLVDHIDEKKIRELSSAFLSYLRRRGQVVTANCRLQVECLSAGVRLLAGVAKEQGRPLGFGPPNPFGPVPLPDLPPGGQASYQFEFASIFPTPSAPGSRTPLARFRVVYDLPGQGISRAEVVALIEIEVTADPVKSDTVDKDAEKTYRWLIGLGMQAQGDRAAEKGDLKAAAGHYRKTKNFFAQLGDQKAADAVGELAQKAETATPEQADQIVKEGRKTKKWLGDQAGGGG